MGVEERGVRVYGLMYFYAASVLLLLVAETRGCLPFTLTVKRPDRSRGGRVRERWQQARQGPCGPLACRPCVVFCRSIAAGDR